MNSRLQQDKSVQIVYLKDGELHLDREALCKILYHEDVKDLPVAVISVAGKYRQGKSFLLSLFLRYMEQKGRDDWIESQLTPEEGFRWQKGARGVTTGILLWSKVFVVNVPGKGKVGVLFMDTQGTFDLKADIKKSSSVFALSTMLSSVQIFNIMNSIGSDDLEHLKLFTDYGRLAMESNSSQSSAPFQSLYFLIRDWINTQDADWGAGGGQKYLEDSLSENDNNPTETNMILRHIYSSFSKISCFLMKFPGNCVQSDDFKGDLSEVDGEFIKQIRDLFREILSSKNLVVKSQNGEDLTSSHLFSVFITSFEIFQSGNIPEPKTISLANGLANHTNAVNIAMELYMKVLDDDFGDASRPVDPNQLAQDLSRVQAMVVEQFKQIPKMGDKQMTEEFEQELHKQMGIHSKSLKTQNQLTLSLKEDKMKLEEIEADTDVKIKALQDKIARSNEAQAETERRAEEYRHQAEKTQAKAARQIAAAQEAVDEAKTEVDKVKAQAQLNEALLELDYVKKAELRAQREAEGARAQNEELVRKHAKEIEKMNKMLDKSQSETDKVRKNMKKVTSRMKRGSGGFSSWMMTLGTGIGSILSSRLGTQISAHAPVIGQAVKLGTTALFGNSTVAIEDNELSE